MHAPETTAAGRPQDGLLPEYAAWLQRLDMTRESIAICCRRPLGGHRALAERVGVEVVAGLLARPRVFQFFGLPYSGRVAHLAEVAMARSGHRPPDGGLDWAALHRELTRAPVVTQETVVLCCVEGHDDATLAAALGCDEASARDRRDRALAWLHELSTRVVPPGAARTQRGVTP